MPPSPAASAAPHTAIRGGVLEIDGVPQLLLGGELQYFRVRAPDFSPQKTHDLWAARLDQLRAAGLNTLSTYVPWDYHAPEAGRFDFSGARDLRQFLDLAAERGFFLIVKPGPFILAEWPYGFGSYGAVPLWWKQANLDALVRDRSGKVFRWHPVAPAIARFRESQPSYASSTFRAATGVWFEAVRAQLEGLLGPGKPVIAMQLDNETNLFWSDVFRIDHHPEALARYRLHLERRYETVGALSEAYGRRFARFDDVAPPRRAGRRPGPPARDWIDHQQELVKDYLGAIRGQWESLGVRAPDVQFLTNDTPQTFPIRDLLLPKGEVKSAHGLYCLDTYPRGIPLPGDAPFDTPYEPEVFCRLYGRWNALQLEHEHEPDQPRPPRFSMGIEIQGGHFSIPLPGTRAQLRPHTVRPEATRQTLLRLFAHGMNAIVLYTAVGGINLDGSDYDFQASLGLDGEERARYRELERFGRLLSSHREALLETAPLTSSVAILASGHQTGPGYGELGEQRIFSEGLRGLFGWCAASGLSPDVIDLALADDAELASYRVLLYPCSGHLPEGAAARLERYVEQGGMLVQLLSAGPLTRSLFPHTPSRPRGSLATRLARAVGSAVLGRGRERLRFHLERSGGSFEVPGRRLPLVHPPRDAEPVLFAGDGADVAAGYRRRVGEGWAVFLTLSPGDNFTGRGYYTQSATEIQAQSLFLRRLLRPTGERRLSAGSAHEEAHVRRNRRTGDLWVFALSNRPDDRPMQLRLRNLPGLGLHPEKTYRVDDVYGDDGPTAAELFRKTGRELREDGVRLGVGPYGATVIRVSELPSDVPVGEAPPAPARRDRPPSGSTSGETEIDA